jgi:hypothetical protein
MLGFSPLASTPLGDDGVAGGSSSSLIGVGITTGNPIVSSPSIVQDQLLVAISITTGPSTVPPTTITVNSALSGTNIVCSNPELSIPSVTQSLTLQADSITTGNPEVQPSTCVVHYSFTPLSIISGNPFVGTAAINALGRRVVSITGNSLNNVTLAENYNFATTSGNHNKVA